MRGLLAACALSLFAAETARAQVPTPYQVTQEASIYRPLNDGQPLSPGLADGDVAALDLPFDFYLYGNAYRRVYINANGFISVHPIGTGYHFPPNDNPQPALEPNGFVAPLWADWCASPESPCLEPAPLFGDIGVYTQVNTSSASIEWRNVRHYRDDQAASAVSFQVHLFEGPSGRVRFDYGPVTVGIDYFGEVTPIEGRIGLESGNGELGMWVGPCVGPLSCSAGLLAGLSGQSITLVADAGQDLSIAGVTAPEIIYSGLPAEMSYRVLSRHGASLGPFQVALHLLPFGQSATTAATRVDVSDPITLDPYESRVMERELIVPDLLEVGRYRFVVVADSEEVVAEIDENNNSATAGQETRVAAPAADLTARAVSVSRDVVRPGEEVELYFEVENSGNRPATAQLVLKLSTNPSITATDLSLGASQTVSLAPLEVQGSTVSVPLAATLPTGDYFVGVILDPQGRVVELDETNNSARSDGPLRVVTDDIRFATESLPPAVLTQFYSAKVEAISGLGPTHVVLSGGELPRGMAFDSEASELFGIPLEPGRFELELTASVESLVAATTLSVIVVDPQVPLGLVSRSLPEVALGSDLELPLLVAGGAPPYAFRHLVGLPAGLVLDQQGVIRGIPVEAGRFQVDFQVRDNAGAVIQPRVELVVRPAPNLQIQGAELPSAIVGTDYQAALFASGGVPPVLWHAIDPLPEGLELAEEGLLIGTPTRISDFTGFRFRVEAVDARGSRDDNELRLFVGAGDQGLSIVTEALDVGTPNRAYETRVRVSGGLPPYTWTVEAGALPAGFSTETVEDRLEISGRLEREGIWSFTLRVEDAQGLNIARPFAIVSRARSTQAVAESSCRCLTSGSSPDSWWRTAWMTLLMLGMLWRGRRRGANGACARRVAR